VKVLVAYASKHGSTRGIADFIGEKLRQRGAVVDVLEFGKVENPEDYDAYVIGSALYFGHWMKEARRFVERSRHTISTKPVWLFSSGPTGKKMQDVKGRNLLDPAVSGPFELDELRREFHPKNHRIFFGTLDGDKMGFFYRQFRKSETVRRAMQEGDFRDWNEIGGWADGIGAELTPQLAEKVGS